MVVRKDSGPGDLLRVLSGYSHECFMFKKILLSSKLCTGLSHVTHMNEICLTCGIPVKVALGISRTNADSQWNPVYRVAKTHRIP